MATDRVTLTVSMTRQEFDRMEKVVITRTGDPAIEDAVAVKLVKRPSRGRRR